MLDYTSEDVVNALVSAKNSNSAIKKFLKNELQSDPKSERFIKDLRNVLLSKDNDYKVNFIEKNLSSYEPHLFVLARYAYAEQINIIAEQITSKYAEEFNSTYSPDGDAIKIINKDKFSKIIKEVNSIIEEGLASNALSSSGFMKNVLLHQIFDKNVLVEVVPLLQ